jgi:6-phosphogluconolactonase
VAADSIERRGRFTVALAGGKTPRALYELLALKEAEGKSGFDWRLAHVFFSDERQVTPDHDDSNCRMASESLLARVPVPPDQVHRVRGENPDADRAAEEYEGIMTGVFGLRRGERPRFDLILLGMGADGHTASLFPGSEALEVADRLAVAVRVPPPGHDRVTLTLPVLNEAAGVIVLAAGAEKAAAVARIAAGEPLPAGLVRPRNGDLLWLIDRDASVRLPLPGARNAS